MRWLHQYYWGLIPLLGWLIVRFIFGFDGLYGQDAYAYLLHAREWKSFFLGGELPGYFFWPPNYSIISGLLAIPLGSGFLSLQVVSLVSFIGTGFFLDRFIKESTNLKTAQRMAFVSLGFLLSAYMFRLGVQGMSDMMTMFFITASFYHLWQFNNGKPGSHIVWWSLFTGLALTTRYPSVTVLTPATLFVAYRLIRIRSLKALLSGCIAGGTIVALAILWKWGSLQTLNDNINLAGLFDWRLGNWFASEFHTVDRHSYHLLPNILFNLSVAVHPGTLVFGAVLLPFSISKLGGGPFRLILLVSIVLYAMFLSGIPFQNSRVMGLTFPLVIMFFAPAFEALHNKVKPNRWIVRTGVALLTLTQLALCTRALLPSIRMHQFELELVSFMEEEYPHQTVYTSEWSQLFDAYKTGNPVIQTYDKPIEFFETRGVFIFNMDQAETKLQGLMPHKNWLEAQEQVNLNEVRCWENGWCVYELSEK